MDSISTASTFISCHLHRFLCIKDNVQHLVDNPSKYDISQHSDNHLDEFSPFRWHLRNARQRAKKKQQELTITLKDLKSQWDKQKGVCPYTGWKLKNPATVTQADGSSKNIRKMDLTPDRASLDRIDSNKGYIPGNIEFVSVMAQFGKRRWMKRQFIDFCHAVATNHTK